MDKPPIPSDAQESATIPLYREMIASLQNQLSFLRAELERRDALIALLMDQIPPPSLGDPAMSADQRVPTGVKGRMHARTTGTFSEDTRQLQGGDHEAVTTRTRLSKTMLPNQQAEESDGTTRDERSAIKVGEHTYAWTSEARHELANEPGQRRRNSRRRRLRFYRRWYKRVFVAMALIVVALLIAAYVIFVLHLNSAGALLLRF